MALSFIVQIFFGLLIPDRTGLVWSCLPQNPNTNHISGIYGLSRSRCHHGTTAVKQKATREGSDRLLCLFPDFNIIVLWIFVSFRTLLDRTNL